jgi:hypothetical protein
LPLPAGVRSLFWEYGESGPSLEHDRDFVIGRVLSAGDWESIRWLRREVRDSGIRDYLSRTGGRLLSRRQLRLWQVLLDLDEDLVGSWLQRETRHLWDRRAG